MTAREGLQVQMSARSIVPTICLLLFAAFAEAAGGVGVSKPTPCPAHQFVLARSKLFGEDLATGEPLYEKLAPAIK